MKTNYPKNFAATIWQPFAQGSAIFKLIADCNSTIEDFKNHQQNWFSEQAYRYTVAEMDSLWGMIECQKKRTAAYYLVDTGRADAFNSALEMVS